MNYVLKLSIKPNSGALLRVLGLVERRAWSTTALQTHGRGQGADLEFDLQVLGERSIEILVRQLNRLHVVNTVEVRP